MNIRRADINDLDSVMPIFDEARKTIASLGIDQWQNGYPDRDVIMRDMDEGNSYLVEDDVVYASFAVICDGEPTYDKIYDGEWSSGNNNRNYLAIHRVAISLAKRGQGIAGKIIEHASHIAEDSGLSSIRIDTHRGNIVMRKMLEKNGFSYCGIIYLSDGSERVAYEKLL